MSSARGYKSYLAFAEESSFGSIPVSAFTRLPINSESLQEEVNLLEEDRIHYLTPLVSNYNQGEMVISGSISLNWAVADYILTLLKHTFGGVITDYTQSKTLSVGGIGQDPLPTSLSFEKAILGGFPSVYNGFTGCRIDSFALQIPSEGIITGTWNLKGKQSSTQNTAFSSSVVIPSTVQPFIGCDFSFILNLAETNVQLPTREVSITVNNNLIDGDMHVGDTLLNSLKEGRRQCKGSLILVFETEDVYSALLNQTVYENVTLKFSFPAATIYWQIKFVRFFGKGSPILNRAGLITASFDFLFDFRGNLFTFIDGVDILTLGTGEPLTLGSGETLTL
jgi:hypothetical protein